MLAEAVTTSLILRRANLHKLRNVTMEIPLGRLVCVTGRERLRQKHAGARRACC